MENVIQTQAQKYNPQGYSEKPMPMIGSKMKAEVTDIKQGRLGELISPEVLKGWRNSDPESPAIEIVALLEDGSIRRRTIVLPTETEVHPQSNLGKWRTIFGEYPSVGQKVYLVADVKGFYQFPV